MRYDHLPSSQAELPEISFCTLQVISIRSFVLMELVRVTVRKMQKNQLTLFVVYSVLFLSTMKLINNSDARRPHLRHIGEYDVNRTHPNKIKRGIHPLIAQRFTLPSSSSQKETTMAYNNMITEEERGRFHALTCWLIGNGVILQKKIVRNISKKPLNQNAVHSLYFLVLG